MFSKFHTIDWSGAIHREEKVGGLTITDQKIVLVYLEKSGKSGESILWREEAPLEPGVIEAGVLKKPEALVLVLERFLEDKKLPSRSVILSLPATTAQPFVVDLVPNLETAEVKNAVGLLIESSLPVTRNEAYIDWQELPGNLGLGFERKKILLAVGIKALIDPYLTAVGQAGFAPVACETHSWSLSRSVNFGVEPASLLIHWGRSAVIFSVYQVSALVFQFDLPADTEGEPGKVAVMAERILRFIASDATFGFDIKQVLLLGTPEEQKKFSDAASENLRKIIRDGGDAISLIALGSARRGLIPRSQDLFISLLSITTEIAYEEERFVSFLSFLQKLAVTLGVFFTAFFVGILLLLNIVSRATTQSLADGAVNVPDGLPEAKNAAVVFNNNVTQLSQLVEQSPQWSRAIDELQNHVNSGLTVNRLEISAMTGSILLEGIAQDRANLLELRNKFQASSVFSSISIPLASLVARGNIPFSFSLVVKDLSLFRR